MNINPENIKGKSKKGIIRRFVQSVTATDEEMEDKETRQGRTTDVKIFVADNKGLDLGKIEATIEKYHQDPSTSKHAKNFLEEHLVEETKIHQDISFVEISTPNYSRTDDFIFIEHNSYFWVITTERKKWTERTIEKLLKYLPEVERVYLSHQDLEEIVEDLPDAQVSGFTAKYHSPYRSRDATLQFHGAESGDLEDAKDTFQATVSRIEYDQKNSPSTAIQGAGTNDGQLSLESVRQGSQSKAVDTIHALTEEFERRDFENYEIENPPGYEFFEGGFNAGDYTSIELFEPDREPTKDTDGDITTELEEIILSKNRYQFGRWGDDSFFVFDKEHEEIFEIGIETPNIVIHARETTTAMSMRNFCQLVIDEFDSTYSIRKVNAEITP